MNIMFGAAAVVVCGAVLGVTLVGLIATRGPERLISW